MSEYVSMQPALCLLATFLNVAIYCCLLFLRSGRERPQSAGRRRKAPPEARLGFLFVRITKLHVFPPRRSGALQLQSFLAVFQEEGS